MAPPQVSFSGAFGLRFTGLSSPRLLSGVPEDTWPLVSIERGRLDGHPPSVPLGHGDAAIGSDWAEVVLFDGGRIELDRLGPCATFRSPSPAGDEDLLHPYLRMAAAVFARWLGRESLHAGGFIVDGGAWGILGAGQSGKSTLVAWLGLAGMGVVTDDLLVLRGTTALAGSRFVDLREPTASFLDCGDRIVPSRMGMRRRLGLSPIAPEVPLKGWIFLEWGPEIELRPIPPAQRLARLSAMRAVQLAPTHPGALLELAGLPAWELSRPRDFAVLPEVADRLVALAHGRQ